MIAAWQSALSGPGESLCRPSIEARADKIVLRTLSFIAQHPLTQDRKLAGFARLARWQIESRLKSEVEFEWIAGAKLLAHKGMTGATGNIYCGLHEFADMAFLLHLLVPGDLFIDVGSNIGSYTVLASAVVGARTIAVEPDPGTMMSLKRNIDLNHIGALVVPLEVAVGAQAGIARFTVGLDTTNHLATVHDTSTREVETRTLDDILVGRNPVLIKLDVEGFEGGVIAGGAETLRNPSLLAIETEGQELDVLEPLQAAGFHRVFYDPFSREFTPTPVHKHSNALFVRDKETCLARLKSAPKRAVLGQML